MKDLYVENYQTLVKETEDTNKWKELFVNPHQTLVFPMILRESGKGERETLKG